MNYRDMAARVAREEGVDPDLFLRLVQQESRFKPTAKSPVGAIGLAQLMPGTAKDLGVNPYDPEDNLRGGARYLRTQLDKFGSESLALAAYNAGPGAVQKYGGIPPYKETQNYVKKIMGSDAPTSGGEYSDAPQQPDVQAPQYSGLGQWYQDYGAPQQQQAAPETAQQPVAFDPFEVPETSQQLTSSYNPYEILNRFGLS